MGVYEGAKIRLVDIQKQINRVREAGEALAITPTDNTQKTKFRIMSTTVSRLQEEFETRITVIIKHFGKPDKDPKQDAELPSSDEIRKKFDESYFNIMILVYISTASTSKR